LRDKSLALKREEKGRRAREMRSRNEFQVPGSRFRVTVAGCGLRVAGYGLRVHLFAHVLGELIAFALLLQLPRRDHVVKQHAPPHQCLYGAGCRAQGLRCRAQGLGFKAQGLGCRAQGLRCWTQGLGLRAQGLGCRAPGFRM